MGTEGKDLVSIRDLEGVVSPHDAVVKRAMEARKDAFKGFTDTAGLALHIGGTVESFGFGERWVVCKEVLPGVEIYFIYDEADDEFPDRLRALYGGKNIRRMHGEDMADATIFIANYMVEYVREAAKK